MRIVIDATELGLSFNRMSGVGRYIFHLIEGLARIDGTNDYLVLFNTFRRRWLQDEMRARLQLPSNWQIVQARIPLFLCEAAALPAELQFGRFDLLHGTFDYLPPVWRAKRVVTIHDVRYLEEDLDPHLRDEEQELSSGSRRAREGVAARQKMSEWQRRTVGRTVDVADAIIVMSDFCARRISEKLKVDRSRIRVVHPGVEQRFSSRQQDVARMLSRHQLPPRYILYVSRFDPLKNPLAAIRAFAQIAPEYPDLHFVLCGPESYYLSHLREKIGTEGCGDRVVLKGFLDDAELPALYAGAELFVLPSLYEGFGLPVLEAFASGTPVVATTASALPEIAGDAALLVDPGSVASLRDAFRLVLNDRTLRESLRSRGRERAARFTWDGCARQTLEIYRSLGPVP